MGASLPNQALDYRREIDGLRAVAVLAVLLFHLNPSWLPGGFTGVDIFFVISGYLITRIIQSRLDRGTFSFLDFYARRVRRIAPAYMAVILVTLLVGAFILATPALRQLAVSAASSAIGAANIHFWWALDSGYFAANSKQVPLLHLWSLGVEEQFYLLWPALLWLLCRWTNTRIRLALLVALIVGSFALAQASLSVDAKFAYYMLPTRAGELGLGALLGLLSPRLSPGRHGSILASAAGYSLLAASLFVLDGTSSFPGVNALLPCLGAALLIYSTECSASNPLNAPLRTRTMVGIGLLSYSLYLWHWPVLALYRYLLGEPGLAHAFMLVAIIVALSLTGYLVIERPLRRTSWPAWRTIGLLYVLPTAMIMALCATLLYRNKGSTSAAQAPSAEQLAIAQIERYTAPAFEFGYNCQQSRFNASVLERPACVHGQPVNRPTKALLWGDSHAAHYIGVVGTIAERAGFRVRNATHSACPPLLEPDDEYGGGDYRASCTEFTRFIGPRLADYQLVFMGASWSYYGKKTGFHAELEKTVRTLTASGKTVVLLGQVPAFSNYDRNCELNAIKAGLSATCKQRAQFSQTQPTAHNRKLQALAAAIDHAHYMDVSDLICPEGRCSAYIEDRPIYFDSSHMSMDGSWVVGRLGMQQGVWDEQIPWLKAATR